MPKKWLYIEYPKCVHNRNEILANSKLTFEDLFVLFQTKRPCERGPKNKIHSSLGKTCIFKFQGPRKAQGCQGGPD